MTKLTSAEEWSKEYEQQFCAGTLDRVEFFKHIQADAQKDMQERCSLLVFDKVIGRTSQLVQNFANECVEAIRALTPTGKEST